MECRSSVLEAAAVREGTKQAEQRTRLARIVSALERLLAHKRAVAWIVGLGLLLHAVSLGLGLTADDHFHAVALRADLVSPGMERAAWDQFAFAKGPEANRAMMEEGAFPWWTDPDLVIAFCRPLSSLTLWLDHKLWPLTPWAMHLHSLVWFAALLGAAWCAMRRLVPERGVALLALLIYALDDARSMPVGWLANRNSLVALVPGFLALAAHARWRSSGERKFAGLATAALIVGLLGGEPALPVCGYLAAYALFLERGSYAARALSLLPYVVVVLAWRALYNQLGYGALHSGIYLDPGREPLAFAVALLERLPILLLSQFALPMSDLWEAYPMLDPRLQPLTLGFAFVVLAGLAWLLWPLLRREPRLRFWALGLVLATIPVCGTHPEDRVLTATGLGGSVLVAELLVALARGMTLRSAGLSRGVAYVLLVIHLLVAPLLLPVRSLAIVSMELMMLASDASIPHGPSAAGQTVVLINPPVDLFAVYLPAFRLSRGISGPKHLRWLATGESALRLERVDARTLAITPDDGFLASSSQQMFRSPARRFELGEQVHLSGLTLAVTRLLPDGRPATVEARFDANLSAAPFRWFRWEHHRYVPFEPPAVGASVVLDAVDLRQLLFD
jgi:hypothetical protein